MAKEAKPAPHYEFGGPPGALATTVSLPLVIAVLYVACNKTQCVEGVDVSGVASFALPSPADFVSAEAFAAVVGWCIFQVVLERVLPATIVSGVVLPDAPAKARPADRLQYRISGHSAFWVSIVPLLFVDLTFIYDRYLQLAFASFVVSLLLSVWVYLRSFRSGPDEALLAPGGTTGNAVYDFFVGRELNPRVGSFDIKEFCELRPGLIGWCVVNIAMAQAQYKVHGSVSWSMLFIVVGEGLYIWDALYNEKAILTTMDITSDGFGYMLAFGDLAWVPFTYTLHARYLVDHDPNLSSGLALFLFAVSLAGFVVFRLSNSEKDAFRTNPKDPAVAHLQTMPTGVPGRDLLVSGWWGAARKINYTGDWLQGLGWSMLCGKDSVVPYFYPIYFAVLLIHRAMRDDELCTRKYGRAVWNEYRKRVPYIFCPYVV
ncbi:Delta(14)-sterol reductase [Diplonema papillatum]|nr:Delta(14)-sterol reductase [Diplonema papillatum]